MGTPLPNRAPTGVTGLDDVLNGGLPRDRIYLVQGDPGVGKTTLGIQFLTEGVRRGERCLYVALSETRAEIDAVVSSHGWSLEGIDVVELSARDQSASLESENTLFETSEVELHETTRLLLSKIERIKPDRVVFDSLSELRLLAQSALRYRRQILLLKQYFVDKRITVLLLDDRTGESQDQQLQSLAHGVITMEQIAPTYGEDRRRLRILKLRGVKFRGGYHDFVIGTGGCIVFPRLLAADHEGKREQGQLSSDVPALDRLIGGGLDAGTATLIMGPAGCGKSSIGIQYAIAAAKRGEHVAIFTFDERLPTLFARTRSLGLDLEGEIKRGRIVVRQIDPAEMGPGEFAGLVRHHVENDHTRVLVIDSINGYLHAMPEEKLLTVQMHELLSYLSNHGVTTVLILAQHGLLGGVQSPVDLSYLADTILLLRYFEAVGRIRKAISVVKKRSGAHENAIRELTMDSSGLHVGAPLDRFTGVLGGIPRFEGALDELTSS